MKNKFLNNIFLKNIEDLDRFLGNKVSFDPAVIQTVVDIIERIKDSGDSSLLQYCRKFDKSTADNIYEVIVSSDELKTAAKEVPKKYPELVEAFGVAYKNLKNYHEKQFENEAKDWFIKKGEKVSLGQVVTAIDRVGIYIPGGRYLYPSSVLMAAVPAMVAGVNSIAVATPPGKDNRISEILLYLFSFLGIDEIYKIGGAQAIAAFAFGTETIGKVDKIVGPGNIYVTAAKKLVFGSVGIDSLAGPSEVLIITDGSSNPAFAAADLISQAEHDPEARCLLLSTNRNILDAVSSQVCQQIDKIASDYPGRFDGEKVISTMEKNCYLIYNPELDFLIEMINRIAPEHLEILVSDFKYVLSKVRNAGAIFVGENTPVAVGDYICGTNHVIPTGGNARFSSPLGVYDFCKKSSIAHYDYSKLLQEKSYIEKMADFENLLAHKNSIRIRFEK